MPIQVLPDEVASAIAAGEVVERPSSVVKELVENSLDADASRVDIEIAEGGKTFIQVADDGQGIPPDQIELALARYATSKLSQASDLFDIQTLGFRGEALSSIAAVSRLELKSAVAEQGMGRRLSVEGGETRSLEPIGAPAGTVVTVRDLFYNVPARRSFLKSDTTERRRISDFVTRYALAYPHVRFRLSQDGRLRFQTSGSGDRREVLAEVFGLDRSQQMIALSEGGSGPIAVTGFISPPSVNRSNRRELTFFVNGRWVQDASLSAAVLQAYHGLLMVGRYPMAVLFLKMPPEAVDVNVHPAKAEVRFREPRSVFSVVQRTVRATLLRQAPPPSVDLDRSWQSAGGAPETARAIDPSWQLAGEFARQESDGGPTLIPAARRATDVPLLRTVGQVGQAYLVAEGPDGVYLIDQHAAHERILFERFMDAHQNGEIESQGLLEPVTVELDPAEAELLEERLPALTALGFEVEPFGQRAFRVRSVPAMLTRLPPERALRSVVEDFEEDEAPLQGQVEAIIAARVCKGAAIKAGQVLSLEEQRTLVRDLEDCRAPRSCPHGRPTMIHLSVQSLERQFGRRG